MTLISKKELLSSLFFVFCDLLSVRHVCSRVLVLGIKSLVAFFEIDWWIEIIFVILKKCFFGWWALHWSIWMVWHAFDKLISASLAIDERVGLEGSTLYASHVFIAWFRKLPLALFDWCGLQNILKIICFFTDVESWNVDKRFLDFRRIERRRILHAGSATKIVEFAVCLIETRKLELFSIDTDSVLSYFILLIFLDIEWSHVECTRIFEVIELALIGAESFLRRHWCSWNLKLLVAEAFHWLVSLRRVEREFVHFWIVLSRFVEIVCKLLGVFFILL